MSKTTLVKKMLERSRELYQSPKLFLMFRSLENAANAVENFELMAAHRSPGVTPESHALNISAASKKLADAAQRFEIELFYEHSRLRESVDRQITAKARLEALPSGVEIRQALRQMPENERRAVISTSFKSGNHEVLSALVHGNSITSGLNDELRSVYIVAHETNMAPAEVAERTALDNLLSDSAHSIKVCRDVALCATDPAFITQIQKSVAEALAYSTNFEASLGGEAVA